MSKIYVSTIKNIKNRIVFPSFLVLVISLAFPMSSTGAQDMVEVSINEFGLRDQPQIKGADEDTTTMEEEDEKDVEGETMKEENKTTAKPNQTKPKRTQDVLSEGLMPTEKGNFTVANLSQFQLPPFNIKVAFGMIDVFEDHDYGDGEWDLIAYVQGKKIDLTRATPHPVFKTDLWDISDGGCCHVAAFKNGLVTSVTIENKGGASEPLSIFTVGSEIDGCFRSNLPAELSDVQKILKDHSDLVLKIGRAEAEAKTKALIAQKQKEINSRLNDGCYGNLINKNDILGTINLVLFAPDYGKRLQSSVELYRYPGFAQWDVVSTTGDFVLMLGLSCPVCTPK